MRAESSRRRPPVEPRWGLAAVLVYLVATALVPLERWPWLGVPAVVLVVGWACLGVSAGEWLRRWMGVVPVVAGLGILVGWSHPARAELGWAGVAVVLGIKSVLMVGAVVLLGVAYGMRSLLTGLRELGLPAALVATLSFMERYVHVLGDERDRMLRGQAARGGRQGVGGWVDRGRLLGALVVRALERGERIEAALEARGWSGRELPPPVGPWRRG